MHIKLLLIGLVLIFTCCKISNEPTIEPLLFEKDFCPYIRLFDTYCNGDKEWRNDDQWKKIIEDMLIREGVVPTEIKLGFKKTVNSVGECPCGAITGHYADVLVNDEDKEKLIAIGFKMCEDLK